MHTKKKKHFAIRSEVSSEVLVSEALSDHYLFSAWVLLNVPKLKLDNFLFVTPQDVSVSVRKCRGEAIR